MRKFLAVLVLAAGLGGCATTGGLNSGKVDAAIAQVRALAIKYCGYEPTAETVINIVASFFPSGTTLVGSYETLAHAICAAVAPAMASTGKALTARRGAPRVHGVAVRGRFVR